MPKEFSFAKKMTEGRIEGRIEGRMYWPLDYEQNALLEWFGNKRAKRVLQMQRYDVWGEDNAVWLLFETSVGTVEHGYVHHRFGDLWRSNREIASKLF